MKDPKIYVVYSKATDETGPILAEALNAAHGYELPNKSCDVIIFWGAKVSENIALNNNTVIFNHPSAIKTNRNKLLALELLKRAETINIAPFAAAEKIRNDLNRNTLSIRLPCIGRFVYHQGGTGFFLCLTKTHLKDALNKMNVVFNRKGYFQEFIDSVREYRIHVFKDKVLAATVKIERENLQNAFIEYNINKAETAAKKLNMNIDKATLEFVLKEQAKNIKVADPIVRSNTRGYKFVHEKITNVPDDMLVQSIEAVKVLGLDFGAVDCVIDSNNKSWVLEVNSGPGLEGKTLEIYINAFKQAITEAKTSRGPDTQHHKKTIEEKLKLLSDLAKIAEDNEAKLIEKLAKKLLEL